MTTKTNQGLWRELKNKKRIEARPNGFSLESFIMLNIKKRKKEKKKEKKKDLGLVLVLKRLAGLKLRGFIFGFCSEMVN